jgi:protein-disulfide isomerase/uncharacterized membrane protein
MSGRKNDARSKRSPPGSAAPRGPVDSPAAPPAFFWAGGVFLLFAAVMSALLSLDHLGGFRLPGCGEDSACQQAARSVWGKVPGIGWPVSYLGFAYFTAALLAWCLARGALPQAVRFVARLGALGSAGFCIIIAIEKLLCAYCLAAHVGNFAFWLTLEATRRRTPRRSPALVGGMGAFIFVTAVLALFDRRASARAAAEAETERGQAVQQMIQRTHPTTAPATQPATRPAAPETQPTTRPAPAPATTPVTTPATAPPPAIPSAGFIGRYPWGPLEAPVRVVMFTGYQCPDCAYIERQVQALQRERKDVCISIKHFVFNADCNAGIKKTLHPNGCWAARAAEAAGILWGSEGFWKLHHWLFERKGEFVTTQELEDGIRSFGYDPNGFVATMTSDRTMQIVKADAAEAEKLGIHFTPMIFVNGVELKGWDAPMALVKTVEDLAATNPPARGPAGDHPPLALEKYIADWREQTPLTLPPDPQPWTFGPDDAALKIVLWGDYQEPGTADMDGIIRAYAAEKKNVQYTYRHFPFNSDCNPNLAERRFPQACLAARAAEAAGQLGGPIGFWRMHAWLMENRTRVDDETLRAVAQRMEFDPIVLFALLETDEIKRRIEEDTIAGKQLPRLRLGMPPGIHGIPSIFINNKFVPRSRLDDKPVLREILEAAASGK